jgi:nicotinamidase-related amidase
MKKLIISFLIILAAVVLLLFINLMVFVNRAQQISEGVLIENFDKNKSALLVVDIQEATTGEYGTSDCYTNNSDEFISNINDAINIAADKNIPVIYIKNETENFLINIINNSLEKGGEGSQFDKRLLVLGDMIISKEKNDAFSNPQLDSLLQHHRIYNLYFSGLDAAFCVNNTIQAANNRGYNINVIDDILISESDSLKTEMLNSYKVMGVNVISLDDYPLYIIN